MTSLTRIKMLLLMVVSMVSMGMAAVTDVTGEDCTSIVKVLLQNPHTGESHVVGDANAIPVPAPNLFGRAVRPGDGWITITTTETSCVPRVASTTISISTVDPVVVSIVSTPPVISHTSTVITSFTTTVLETSTVPTTSVAVSTPASAPTDVITTVVPVVTSIHVSSTTGVSTVSSKSTTSKATATAIGVTTQSGTPMSSSLAAVPATTSTATAKPVTSSHGSTAETTSASTTSIEVTSSSVTKAVPVPGSTVTGKNTDFATEPCPTGTELTPAAGKVTGVPVAPAPTPVTSEIVFTITVPCSHTEKCRSTEAYSTSTLVFSNPTGTHITAPTAPAVVIISAPETSVATDFVTEPCPSGTELAPAPAVTEITVTVDIPCTESTKCVSTQVVTTAISVSVVPVMPIPVTVTTPETTEVPVAAPAPPAVPKKETTEAEQTTTTHVIAPAPAPTLETTIPESPPQAKISAPVPETITATHPVSVQTTLATVPQPPVPKGSNVPQKVPQNGESQIAAPTVPHPASSESQAPSAPVFNGASAAGFVDGRLLTMSIFVVLANAAHFVMP
ncbi:uncharacterized protein N7446_008155 [Penicillium canescens]|uniref:uncharacterized protein n=1 Tax=Penicillium canescens TaxID=5083 RepID=UPI0026E09FDB|nr:uncharacterized protein N7446_008155 [Penicillium canescens]KAJ6058572.1 hypothetical protein N7446_008155 [Penicillium canescens]